MISATTGRRTLMGVVIAGFILAFVILFGVGYGGAVSDEVTKQASDHLLKLYVPLLALVASFYFSEWGQSVQATPPRTSLEAFLFATAIILIWSGLAPIFIAFSETVEGALRRLDSFEVFGHTLAIGALTFYFSKSAPKKE